MEKCRNTQCLKPLDQSYFYCCNQFDKYCEACSRHYKCMHCHRLPSHRSSLLKCDICFSDISLLACNCSVVCSKCTYLSTICRKCSKAFIPISMINPPPLRSTIPTKPNPDSLSYTNSYLSNNYVDPSASSSKNVSHEREYCAACYKFSNVDCLFCNINCGHLLCRQCLTNSSKYCPYRGCGLTIDRESCGLFLGLCLECGGALGSDTEGLNLCYGCLSRAKEAETAFEKEPCQDPEPEVKNDQAQQETQETQETQEIQETTSMDDQFREMKITVQEPVQEVQAETQVAPAPLYSTLSPRNNYFKKTSNNYSLLHPNRVPEDEASNRAKSTQSKASTSRGESRKKGICSFCNLDFESEFILSFKECKKSTSKKHKGCMCCLMRTRSNRVCPGCLKDEELEVSKKLVYQQMRDEERITFKEEIKAVGLWMCSRCSIVVDQEKFPISQSLPLCRLCCLK